MNYHRQKVPANRAKDLGVALVPEAEKLQAGEPKGIIADPAGV